ncbi:MAG: hypothetical protein GKR94_07020 [Gammaproteobacteria bacterium]|nr:hypothetical protein [Gammaproteobacteria bacterium]
MKHYASSKFWTTYQALPESVRRLADKNYSLLEANPRHPLLHFKRVGELWSVRVGDHYRALGVDVEDGINWFWIGTHSEYDKIIS